MRHWTRFLLCSLLCSPIMGGLLVTAASSAGAQESPQAPVADLTCVISGTANISPGISLLSEPQKLTGKVQGGTAVSPLTPCTSLTGVPYQGFTMTLTGSGSMGCITAALQGGMDGTGKVTWDNGDTSGVNWSFTTVAMVPVVTVTLTSGALSGSSVVVVGTPDSLTGSCGVLSPVTSLGFAGAAEILHPGG